MSKRLSSLGIIEDENRVTILEGGTPEPHSGTLTNTEVKQLNDRIVILEGGTPDPSQRLTLNLLNNLDERITEIEDGPEIESITFGAISSTLTVGSSISSTVITTPSDFEGLITFLSSDSEIATIEQNTLGTNKDYIITGVSAGTVTLTASVGTVHCDVTLEVIEDTPVEPTIITFSDDQVDDLTFTNATLTIDNGSTFECTISNNTQETVYLDSVTVNLLDENGDLVYALEGTIMTDHLDPNDSVSISTGHYEDLYNVVDVRYEINYPQPSYDLHFGESSYTIDTSESSTATITLTSDDINLNTNFEHLSILSSNPMIVEITNTSVDSETNTVSITLNALTEGTVSIEAEMSVFSTYASTTVTASSGGTSVINFPDQTVGDLSFTNASGAYNGDGTSSFTFTFENVSNDVIYLAEHGITITFKDSNQQVIATLDPIPWGGAYHPNYPSTHNNSLNGDITTVESIEYNVTIQQPELVWSSASYNITEGASDSILLISHGFDIRDYSNELTVTSSDNNIFTVDNIDSQYSSDTHVQISGVAMGTANITATISSLGFSVTSTVEVEEEPPVIMEDISWEYDDAPFEIKGAGNSINVLLYATDLDLNDYSSDLTITTGDSNIATVGNISIDVSGASATVTINGVSEGDTTITASIDSLLLSTAQDVSVINDSNTPIG